MKTASRDWLGRRGVVSANQVYLSISGQQMPRPPMSGQAEGGRWLYSHGAWQVRRELVMVLKGQRTAMDRDLLIDLPPCKVKGGREQGLKLKSVVLVNC